MMEECILGSSKHTDRVDTDMLVESFILGIYQCLEEIRCYLIIFYRLYTSLSGSWLLPHGSI